MFLLILGERKITIVGIKIPSSFAEKFDQFSQSWVKNIDISSIQLNLFNLQIII